MKRIRCHADNIAKHGVTPNEIAECIAARHLRLRNPSGPVGTYLVVGQTAAGRYLEVVFEDRVSEWWVFHAMTARDRIVKLYRRRRKQHGL